MKQSNKEKLNYILFIVILVVGETLAGLVAVGMVVLGLTYAWAYLMWFLHR
jgi:hypothetical protein